MLNFILETDVLHFACWKQELQRERPSKNPSKMVNSLMTENHSLSIEHILTHYSLGELMCCEQNLRGYCNTSFAIQTLQAGKPTWYFLRRYKASIQEEEILFEHTLIQHLSQFADLRVATLQLTREGKTYLKEPCQGFNQTPTFFAIFDFLPGEDRYTWINPHCTEMELRNSAALLARYHRAVWNFQPQGQRKEPDIQHLLPMVYDHLTACLEKPIPAQLKNPIQETLPFLKEKIDQLSTAFSEPAIQSLPKLIIHCDYHPGNLRFDGEEVVGLFDFDWAKRDWRIFDIALALFYFTTEWECKADGHLRLDEMEIFLSAYQQNMRTTAEGVPLNEKEQNILWQFIEAANLYVLNWTILDILNKTVDPEEYAMYLWHGLNTAKWLHQTEKPRLVLPT